MNKFNLRLVKNDDDFIAEIETDYPIAAIYRGVSMRTARQMTAAPMLELILRSYREKYPEDSLSDCVGEILSKIEGVNK